MADTLQRLVNVGSFAVLQQKLDNWLDDYDRNTCDQNVNRCVEVIELNARVQAQLFRILNLTATEGGTYGGLSAIKARLLPWLSYGLVSPWTGLSQGGVDERELRDVQDMYERSLANVETDLSSTQAEADQLKLELEEKKIELDSVRRKLTTEKLLTESEVQELKTKLRLKENELDQERSNTELADKYERQLRRLKNDVTLLTNQKALMSDALSVRSTFSTPLPYTSYSGGGGLNSSDESSSQKYRQLKLVNRFNDMFSVDRFSTLDVLRDYSVDLENNQRIIFAVMQESFMVARLALINLKRKVRLTLSSSHTGPETLEEAVMDYIGRNPDMNNVSDMVSDVIRSLNRQPGLVLPPDMSYSVIQLFIREACKLAFAMVSLPRPLELAPAGSLELFDDAKYRRSYDSNHTAPLVAHHIWPCLIQGTRVIVKGEAFTERSAALLTPRRSRSPVRSLSPTRSFSPTKAGSRSSSPFRGIRNGTQSLLY